MKRKTLLKQQEFPWSAQLKLTSGAPSVSDQHNDKDRVGISSIVYHHPFRIGS